MSASQLTEIDNRYNSCDAEADRNKAAGHTTQEGWSCAARELRRCNQAHSVQSEQYRQLALMLQADIGRVNARAGEERRIVPQRDEKTLIYVAGVIVGVTLRPSLSVFSADDPGNRSTAWTSSIYHPPTLRHNLSIVV